MTGNTHSSARRRGVSQWPRPVKWNANCRKKSGTLFDRYILESGGDHFVARLDQRGFDGQGRRPEGGGHYQVESARPNDVACCRQQ
jgi:hypothetical protein